MIREDPPPESQSAADLFDIAEQKGVFMPKRNTDARTKEIRRMLSGITADVNEGRLLMAAENVRTLDFHGLYAGLYASHLFGLTVHRKQYRVKLKSADGKERTPSQEALRGIVEASFLPMGRPAALRSAPDAAAVMTYPLLFNPCLLTAEFAAGGQMLVCFYTARTPLSRLNVRRSCAGWLKKLPADVVPAEETPVTLKEQIL